MRSLRNFEARDHAMQAYWSSSLFEVGAVQIVTLIIGPDPDFAKYFAKYALPARREKFPEISPVRLM